jgi:hypothetical protein
MCRESVMAGVMDSLMVPRHADHRAVTHIGAWVCHGVPLCLMERESVVTVMGPFVASVGEVATHIYLPKPTRQPSAADTGRRPPIAGTICRRGPLAAPPVGDFHGSFRR